MMCLLDARHVFCRHVPGYLEHARCQAHAGKNSVVLTWWEKMLLASSSHKTVFAAMFLAWCMFKVARNMPAKTVLWLLDASENFGRHVPGSLEAKNFVVPSRC